MSKHPVDTAAEILATLQTFATVVTILEGGGIYDADSFRASERIITIAHAEQQRLVRRYDKACAEAKRQLT